MPSLLLLLYLPAYLPFLHFKFKAKILQPVLNKFLHVICKSILLSLTSHPTAQHHYVLAPHKGKPKLKTLWGRDHPPDCCGTIESLHSPAATA